MYPLFESVCVLNGEFLNKKYHTERFHRSYQKFYWQNPSYEIFHNVTVPAEHQEGRVKLRISYGREGKQIHFHPYKPKKIERLKIVFDDIVDYDLKFEDRSQLNQIFELREDCDDVLIIKKNAVTDTSYANIIFYDGKIWQTPNTCLLKGTKRSQLLDQGQIFESEIHMNDLGKFESFQVINAMLDFDANFRVPVENIKL